MLSSYVNMSSKGPGLCEFLIEAELHQYFTSFKNDLKIQNVSQIKYVTDDDLIQLGMSKPEIRRLKKFFQKHYPQTYLSKFKKMIMPKKEETWDHISLPEEALDKPAVKVPNKHIIPAENIIVNKELGMGEFGVVQQGVWTNDGDRIQVAIKCLSRERMQNNPIEFLKEAAIMHSIDHEHIVRLYGVVLDTNALMLVTELAALRSLLECLKEPSLRSSFVVLSLCNFAIQICDGMQYLEAKRLIHRDLAARNILVFSKNKVKISDFGLSRALGVGKDYYQTNFNVNLKLPIAWCAPECITYLRFTSASDVWAYAVTLWEMFSYGFQPWAALTGHQILDTIDHPNCQRLERPECCPKEYYSIMKKCWNHDPNRRPKFSDLMRILPECKPEQVQAIQDSDEEKVKRDLLNFHAGDIITVLDKNPGGSGGSSIIGGCVVTGLWKGCMSNGKAGLFNPAHTVSYLGSSLPSNKPSTPQQDFIRGDGKNAYSSKRRLRPDMISVPQGDFKHTGHVGLDGAYFGDISFLGGSKYEHIPHQIVSPYKPQSDTADHADTNSTDKAPLITPNSHHMRNSSHLYHHHNSLGNSWLDGSSSSKLLSDHEYHEISDEDTPADSPRFEKQFDLGRSLMDEMDEVLRNYSRPPMPVNTNQVGSEDVVNRRNEAKEAAGGNPTHGGSNIMNGHSNSAMVHSQTSGLSNHCGKSKKKQATVKPISAADEKTLDTAIALANELAIKTMSNSVSSPSATTPPAAHGKHKFSFKFPGSVGLGGCSSGNNKLSSSLRSEGRTFTDEAASIPDIQGCLTSEAKAVYSSLVEAAIPPADHPISIKEETSSLPADMDSLQICHQQVDVSECDTNPLRILRHCPPFVRGKRGSSATLPMRGGSAAGSLSIGNSLLSSANALSASCLLTSSNEEGIDQDNFQDNGNSVNGNAIPLPPRDRARSLLLSTSKPRHERKHPLIIPSTMAQSLGTYSSTVQGSPLNLITTVATGNSEQCIQCVGESEPMYLGLENESSESEPLSHPPPLNPPPPLPNCRERIPCSTQQGVVSGGNDEEIYNEGFDEMIAESFDLLDRMDGASCDEGDCEDQSDQPIMQIGDDTTATLHQASCVSPMMSSQPIVGIKTSTASVPVAPALKMNEDSVSQPPVKSDSELRQSATVAELVEKLDYKEELRAQLDIMSRVLHNKVSEEDCLRALECTSGNVHRGIKLARLCMLVSSECEKESIKMERLLANLESFGWDVAAAAADHLSNVHLSRNN